MTPKLRKVLEKHDRHSLEGIRTGLALADGIVCQSDLKCTNPTITAISYAIGRAVDGVDEMKEAAVCNPGDESIRITYVPATPSKGPEFVLRFASTNAVKFVRPENLEAVLTNVANDLTMEVLNHE